MALRILRLGFRAHLTFSLSFRSTIEEILCPLKLQLSDKQIQGFSNQRRLTFLRMIFTYPGDKDYRATPGFLPVPSIA